jgi:poly(A) polymerase
MNITYSDEELFIFEKIKLAASKLDIPVYIIGGFVRDKLLNRPDKDLDIVCIGDGIALAKETAQKFRPVPEVNIFKNFGTAQIKIYPKQAFKNGVETNLDKGREEAFEIEFVGARKESYNYDSRKPDVEPGTIEEDRMRRDFTINTLAVSLNKNDFGELIDPLNGAGDIDKKIIRTPLPPDQTFSDDPLRMIRAIRFASQLNLQSFLKLSNQ